MKLRLMVNRGPSAPTPRSEWTFLGEIESGRDASIPRKDDIVVLGGKSERHVVREVSWTYACTDGTVPPGMQLEVVVVYLWGPA